MSSGLRPADAHLTGLLSQSIHQPQPGARTTLRAASKGLMLGAVGAAKAMDCFSSVLVFSHWITGPRHPQEAEETGHLLGWGAALFLPLKQSNFGRAMGASVASQNRARPAIAKIIFIHTHTHTYTPLPPTLERASSLLGRGLLGGLQRGCLGRVLEGPAHSLRWVTVWPLNRCHRWVRDCPCTGPSSAGAAGGGSASAWGGKGVAAQTQTRAPACLQEE